MVGTLRQVEFGRAILERLTGASQQSKPPALKYFGVLRTEQKDICQQFEEKVYGMWDKSSNSPPKTRARSAVERPSLSLLCWSPTGFPHFPQDALSKFPAGTHEHGEVIRMQNELREMWREEPVPPTPSPVKGRECETPRVSTGPDLTGASFIDTQREVTLPCINAQGFTVPRRGGGDACFFCIGAGWAIAPERAPSLRS